MKKILILLILASNVASFAQNVDPSQLSNRQLLNYYNQAKASGMTDMEIEQAALARGYTITDINNLRQRLQQTSDGDTTAGGRDTIEVQRNYVKPVEPSRPEEKPTQAEPAPLKIFGSSFFVSGSQVPFEPNLRIATPKNYIIGPDDQLIVDIYGNATQTFKLKVSPEGTVKVLNFAPVYVNGMTIEEATERIVGQLRPAYSGLNRSGTFATVTLGNVRSIKVMVTGEVNRPGTFTVSSLSTVFNVLYLAGGPSEQGTYRSIEIIRDGVVFKKIDLYEFLVKSLTKDNILLTDQDIIHVPPYYERVKMDGQIKRPGIFEAREGETFKDLLFYAGGFTSAAYTASVSLLRSTGREFRVESIESGNFATFAVKNGDEYEVGKILTRYENRIVVGGAVLRPGQYALNSSTSTVAQLIRRAEGLREDAFMTKAILHRKQENLEPEVISFSLDDLMKGSIADIPLKKDDSLSIRSLSDLKQEYTVSIVGEVNQPGVFPYSEHLTVSDLIFLSRGFAEGALPYRIDVSRRWQKADTLGTNETANTHIFTLSSDGKTNHYQNFELKPYDIVFVRKIPGYETQKKVYIGGEVTYPGHYSIIADTERLKDIVLRAGGVKPEGYIEGGTLHRNGERVAVDLREALNYPNRPVNLLMFDGDSINIPKRLETVQISGAVNNNSIVAYDSRFGFRRYIGQGGGYSDKARKTAGYVVYPNGITKRVDRILFVRTYPKIQPGSHIHIPFKDETQKREISGGERAAIISVLGTVAISLVRLITDWSQQK